MLLWPGGPAILQHSDAGALAGEDEDRHHIIRAALWVDVDVDEEHMQERMVS